MTLSPSPSAFVEEAALGLVSNLVNVCRRNGQLSYPSFTAQGKREAQKGKPPQPAVAQVSFEVHSKDAAAGHLGGSVG